MQRRSSSYYKARNGQQKCGEVASNGLMLCVISTVIKDMVDRENVIDIELYFRLLSRKLQRWSAKIGSDAQKVKDHFF